MIMAKTSISPEYFYRDLTPNQCFEILEIVYEDHKLQWETARYLGYLGMAQHMDRKKPMNEVLPLPWDKKNNSSMTKQRVMSEEEKKKLREMGESLFS